MNTSHTSTLTAEQLEAFLEGKLSPGETKRVQHLLDDCELSKEALEGYSMVPGAFADVDALKKSIAAKSGMSWGWGKISLSIIGVAAISAVIALVYPTEKSAVVAGPTLPSQQNAPTYVEPENPLSPQEDHFVNPEAKVVPVTVAGETKQNGGAISTPAEQEFVVAPIQPEDHAHLITDSVPPVVPAKPEIVYNAQVGFIVDLKVTEFDKYYAEPIEVKEAPLTGIPAQYEDDNGMIVNYEEEPTVRQVPADQFLREGLLAFRDARYGKCVSKMDVLLEHNANDINALFYTAVSYVKLEMYSKAIPLLDQILADPNNVFDEEAEWYKALALEGNGDTAAATALFQEIAADGGFYSRQAGAKLK
jgi:hypothetical protein